MSSTRVPSAPRPRRRSRRSVPTRTTLAAAVIAASVVTVGLGADPAAAVSFTCGSTIATSVVLTSDLDCTGKPVTVAAAGITVDLGGHQIRSSEACTIPAGTCTIDFGQGSNGSRLINGELRGASVSTHSARVVLSRLRTSGGLVLLAGEGDQLVDSVTSSTHVMAARSNQVVRRNRVTGGRGIQIFNLDYDIKGITITENVVSRSTVSGIWLTTHFFGGDGVSATITRNTLVRNTGAGLSFAGDLQELGAITVADNLAADNGRDGFNISGAAMPPEVPLVGGPVTLRRNVARRNGRHGFDASWIPGRPTGIVDGGANSATANAASPQCIGVAC